ncbi:ArsR family transcriptional regulator, partial [Candidatus Woesearchaeota archaeon]|nr:ArsR family transcriptional regulator [Candidatus Woesearchaeota archaeon]
MALNDYRLFNKNGEIIVIGDEVELSILELLNQSEKSFSELLNVLKVPKSTLSSKIDRLKLSSVVAEISVP